ncbi:MAG: hypothetical protein MUF45_08510, partial [Spirosomaceae bacterium]|nr:hypothetical protein [Spirosomataceae bacterium]
MTKRNWYIVFILLTIVFSWVIIKDFTNPLTGSGDEGVWTYYGYYFAKNIQFNFFPIINFTSDQIAYPYGINQVLQDWSIERELWYAVFYKLISQHGPWLQYYFVVSLLISAFGIFYLLRYQFSVNQSGFVALLVTFCNFYAINKYPGHYAHVILHWTNLSIVSDFLIAKWVFERGKIPLHFLFLKAFFLLMLLGLNIGYVAGYALSSFTLTTIFSVILYFYRAIDNDGLTSFFSYFENDFNLRKIQIFVTSLLILLFGYLYLPILFQIIIAVKEVDSSSIPMWHFWDNPLRLLLPFLPKINPLDYNFQSFMHDSPEGFGPASPGLFFVVLALIGFWQAGSKRWILLPFIIFMAMCLVFHTTKIPTLKIFPWFEYSRVSSRSTLIYPLILSLVALFIDWSKLKTSYKFLIIFLGVVEISTVYHWHFSHYHPNTIDGSFTKYMDKIRQSRGEAVLDFPFCAMGDNGIGAENCMFWQYTTGLHTLQQFHDKKTTTFFIGRV